MSQPLGRWTPPAIRLPGEVRLACFDRGVDEWFEQHLRHCRAANATFYAASALADHGMLWLLLAGAQSARRGRPRPAGPAVAAAEWRRPLIRAMVGLGVESALVNGPIKWLFRRERPIHEGPRPLHLRRPRTSSFPSGHATAAFFGAAVLRDGDPIWPLYYALAVIVAASRVHVRIHHASDVVGGMVIGIGLGELARHWVPVPPPNREPESPPPPIQ
ncbi:MAG: phosphatase PAP2 family protein [Acidimicrobiales bacterium]